MVIMFLANGFEESEAILPLDLLRRGGIDVKTVSINDEEYVTGSHGITVKADMAASDLGTEAYEMVILPGGPGTENLDNCETVKNIVKKTYNEGGYLSAICAAPMVLGKLGLLEGKKAACYPGYEKYLMGADVGDGVRGYRAICDGRFITACGIGEAHTFAYLMIKELKGEEVAKKVFSATRYLD